MKLLTNERILGMHRNARHSHQVWRRTVDENEYVLWTAHCAEGGQYAAVFNAGESAGTVEIPLSDLEIFESKTALELWSGDTEKLTEKLTETLTVKLSSHGAKAFILK